MIGDWVRVGDMYINLNNVALVDANTSIEERHIMIPGIEYRVGLTEEQHRAVAAYLAKHAEKLG